MQKNNSFSYFLCALLGLFFIHAQEMQAPKIPDGIKSFLRLHKINVSDRADYSAEEIADLKKMYDARKTTSRGEFDDLETSSVDSDGEDAVTRYRQGTSIREIILTPLKTSASAEERYRQHQTLLNVFQRLQPTFDSTGKDLAPKAHKAQYDSFEEAQPSFVTPQHSAGIDDDLFGFPSTRPPASAPKAGKGIAEVPARTERAPDSSPRLPASRKVTGLSSMPVWGESPRPTVTPTSVAVAAPTPRPRPIVEAKQPVVPSTATPGGPPKPVAGPSEDEKSAILAQVFRESEERKQEETRRAKEAAAARGQAPAASLTFARDEYDDLLEELGANPVTPRTPLKRTTVPPVASSTEPKAPAGPSSDGRTDPKQPVTRPMSFSLTSPALQPSSRPTAPRKDLADTKSTVIATGRRPEDERSQPGTGLSTAAGGLRSFRFTGASDAPVASQGEPTATPTGFARRQGNGLVGPARTTVALGSLKPVLGEDGYSSEEDSPRIFGATPLRPPTSDVPLHNPAQRATGWDPVRDSVTQPNGAVSPTDFDFSEGEVRPKGKGTAALPPPPKGSQRTLAGTPRPTPRALSKLLTAAPSASGPLSPTESLVSRVTTPSSADSPASDGETSEGQVFPPVPRKLSLQPLGPKGLAPAPSTSLGNIPEAGPSGFKPRTLRTPTKASPTGPQAPAAGSFSILTFDGPGGMKPVDTELPSPTGSFSLPSSPTGSQVSASPPASPSSLESGVVREAPKRATKSRSLRVDTSAPLSDGEVTPAPLSTTSSSGDGDLFLGDTPTPGGGSTRGSRSPGEAKEGDSPLSPLAGAPSLFGPRKNADLLGGENFSVIAERPFTFSSTQRRASTTADTPPASPTSGVVPPPRAIPKKGTSSTPGAAVRELEAAGGDALTSLTSIPKPPRKSAAESQPRDDGEDTPRTPLTRTPIAPPLPPSESATSSVVLPGASGPLPATPPPSPSVHEEPTVSGSPETDADASRLAAGAAVVLRKTTPKGSPQDRDTVGARPEDDGAGATLVGRGFLPTSLPRSSSGPSTTFRPFEAPPPPDAPKAATRTAADSPGPLRGPSGPEALRGSGDSGRWFLGGGSPSLPGSGDVSARSSLSFGSELPQDTDATIKFGRRRGQPAKGPSTSPVARKFASLREQPQPVSPRRPVTPVRTVDPSRVRKKANPNARPTIMPTSALPWLSKDYAPRRTPSAASSVGRVPPLKGEPFSKPSTDVRTSTTPAGGGPGSPTALPTATSTPLRDGKSKPGGKRDDRESVVVVSEGSGGPAPRSPFVEVPPGAKSRVDGVRPRPDRAPASMQFFRAARRDSIASTLTFGSGSTDSLPEGRRSSPRETALIIPPERVRRAFTAKAEPQKPSAPGGWVTTISAPVSRKQKLTPEQRKRIQQIREEGEMRSYEILQSMRAGKVPAGADTKVAPVAQAPEPTPAESEKASLQARIKAVAQKLAVDDDTLDVTAERSGTRPEEVVFKYSRREVLVDQLKALQGSYARKFGDDDFIADSQAFASQHEIKAKIVKQQEIKERLGLNQRKLGDIAARRIEQKRTFKDTSHDSAAARKPAPVAHKAQPARPVRAG